MPARSQPARQVISVRGKVVDLPLGVTAAEWALERVRRQNPRIRGLLACLRLLDDVLDSNYFILHCSTAELDRTWQRVQEVIAKIRRDVAPHLKERSPIPAIEEARRETLVASHRLERDVLAEADRLPEKAPREGSAAIRRNLSSTIGKLYGFLQDSFSRLMAADPRSHHEADYYLSRKFFRQVEETEALYVAVFDFGEELRGKGSVGQRALTELSQEINARNSIPVGPAWHPVADFLHEIRSLVPRLTALVVMPGVRFSEARALDHLTSGLALQTELAFELQKLGVDIALHEELGSTAAADQARAASETVARRLAQVLQEVESEYRILVSFIPRWLEGLERRRALVLLPDLDDTGDDLEDRSP